MSDKIIETMARGTHGYAFRLLEREPDAYKDERVMREVAIETCEKARLDAAAAIAALDAAGYAIVRRKPDEAMLDAAFEAVGTGANELEAERAQYRHAYQLMIAAQEPKP
jgi:hypothetical protein